MRHGCEHMELQPSEGAKIRLRDEVQARRRGHSLEKKHKPEKTQSGEEFQSREEFQSEKGTSPRRKHRPEK